MKANKIFRIALLAMAITLLVGCSKTFKPQPPIQALDPKFTELTVDPTKDTVYALDNGTKITIKANSLLNANGEQLTQLVKLKYRQFNDGVSIFLAGMPMKYKAAGEDKILQTGGMFEIRGDVDGKPLSVDPQKPITITLGSNFTDTRMGFFKLDDESGEWNLVDIPTSRVNSDIDSLKNRLNELMPKNLYVFGYERMADVFLNEDYFKIRSANTKELIKKFKASGINSLEANFYQYDRTTIKYNGSIYDAAEMLWKTAEKLEVPVWISELTDEGAYDAKKENYIRFAQIKSQMIGENTYKFTISNSKKKLSWSCTLEIDSHLRDIFKRDPEKYKILQAELAKELKRIEENIKKAHLIEYTVEINQMGVFNCDKPILFSPMRPELTLILDGKAIDNDNITQLAIFNSNLSSVSYPITTNPLTVGFFKGTNKVMVVTKDGDFGLLTGAEYSKMAIDTTANLKTLHLNLKKVDVKDETQLREMLEE